MASMIGFDTSAVFEATATDMLSSAWSQEVTDSASIIGALSCAGYLRGSDGFRLQQLVTANPMANVGEANCLDDFLLALLVEAGTHAGLWHGPRPTAVVIPAGGGKTTLCEKHPESFIDIDNLVPEHHGKRTYQTHQAWTVANFVAMWRVHV
jgi:hypothetical protein